MNQGRSATADTSHCDREPIHIPGSTQPHGVLFVLREPELTIVQVSDNVADHLGVAVDEVLSRPLSAVWGEAAAEQVRLALGGDRWDEMNPLALSYGERCFDGIVHRHQQIGMLEIEPVGAVPSSVHHPLRPALIAIEAARSLRELFTTVTTELRRLTGFERVLLYRFDEAGHGSVEAEARAAELEPYLGLRYPASDIPFQARELYRKNWLRIIPDARYVPARLVPELHPDTGAPLDLSFAVLRSVSPVHLEYLANMGIRASMSVSVIVRDQLWGLISCGNHSEPRSVPYEIRSACEILGRLASLQIAALEDREQIALRHARLELQQRLAGSVRARDGVLDALMDCPADLLALVDAEGVVVVNGSDSTAFGRTPPPSFVTVLVEWLGERGDLEPFCTASLPALFAPAMQVKDSASGLMTFAVPSASRMRVLWFRPEVVQTVHWGGDPRKPAEIDPSLRLHPRRSFELWKEEVRLRSQPWSATDIEAARDLRRTAVEINLERQIIQERRAVRLREDVLAVASHDLRNPLNVIGIQASALLRQVGSGTDERSGMLRDSMQRIQRSVGHMRTLIGDLLDMAKIEAGQLQVQYQPQSITDTIDEALLIMRPLAEGKRIAIAEERKPVPMVNADRSRLFQVLSNLLGNAIKFTPEEGAITVRTEPHPDGLLLTVADTGPGIPPDQLPHIFNRYWQPRRANREGSGLGLYIAKGIVEAHGGKIWVESAPNAGTQFKLTLPAAPSA
ncbi:MAG TPA: ATP-binding protein [Terriglobales bacterium]|nr:ATP-binding protein [Terriglobales bacterium]